METAPRTSQFADAPVVDPVGRLADPVVLVFALCRRFPLNAAGGHRSMELHGMDEVVVAVDRMMDISPGHSDVVDHMGIGASNAGQVVSLGEMLRQTVGLRVFDGDSFF